MSCWESCTDLHHTQVITNSTQGFVSWRNKDFTRCSFIKHCSSASHTVKSRHHFKIQVCYSVARATYRENRIFPNLLAPPNSPVGRAGLLVWLVYRCTAWSTCVCDVPCSKVQYLNHDLIMRALQISSALYYTPNSWSNVLQHKDMFYSDCVI